MPAYNEAQAVGQVVEEFLRLPEVDEVVVVDNNSSDGTSAIAERAGARIVREARRGYGHASRCALLSAAGDYIVVVESDATFRANDLYKFLAYAGEFDVVFGTRTSRSCIWTGANMGFLLRYGNCAVAKLLEYLHNGPCLTDVGCTYKLIQRQAMHRIAAQLTVGGSCFSAELMLVAIRSGLRCVEIPVHYQTRIGESKITGQKLAVMRVGLGMVWLILRSRFRRIPRTSVLAESLP